MHYLAFIIALCVCVGCTSSRHGPITPLHNDPWSQQGRKDIIEAVFRHMCQPEPVEEEVSHNVNLVHKVYFLEIGDSQDPNPQFLERLGDLKSPVKPISAGEWKGSFIYDKTTGERGAAFTIRSISIRSWDECEVKAVIHSGGGLSASGPIYRVTRKNGKWRVVDKRLKWIS